MSQLQQSNNSLDYLRGIAILFVVICHFSLENNFWSSLGLSDPFFSGVELFFIISGYGISCSVLSKPFIARDYIGRRCRRIYPSLITMLFLCYLVNALLRSGVMPLSEWGVQEYVRTDNEQLADTLRVLTGTYILGNSAVYAFGALWYLSAQMQFYVIIGFLAAVSPNSRVRKNVIYCVSAVIVVICLICRITVFLVGTFIPPQIIDYLLAWKMDVPFYGVLIHMVSHHINYKPRKVCHRGRDGFALAILVVAPLVVLANIGSAVASPTDNRLLTGLGYPFCIICYSILVFLCVICRVPSMPFSKILAYLSSRSYQLFLYNFVGLLFGWLVINYFFSWVFYTGNSVHYGIAQFILGGGFTYLLAELDYRLIEKHLCGYFWPKNIPNRSKERL